MELQIRFCTSDDGTRIAYATLGEGSPLVVVPGWAGNLELMWEHPDSRAWVERLAQGRRFIQFDRRAFGASQRDVDDLSLEAHVADIAALVDHLQLERFDVFAAFDGAAVVAAYVAQHPERVSRLVLWAPFPRGEDIVTPGAAQGLIDLVRQNWSLGRRAIADVCYPSGPTDLQRWFAGYLRQSVSPEVAAKYIGFHLSVDVASLLPQVKAPTLVLHRRGDRNVPIRAGRDVASLIPEARFLTLEGDITDWARGDISYVERVVEFLDEGRIQEPEAEAPAASDVYTILFTDMESSTALTRRLGDAKAQELLRAHNTIVRDALKAHVGSEIKHTGDGIMASFATASSALECAIAIQRAVAEQSDSPLRVRIGLNAGEPVAEEQDLFGASVQLARRVCDHADPGQIVAADVVRQLATGKGFLFSDLGDVVPKGFEEPVRLYEVRWRD